MKTQLEQLKERRAKLRDYLAAEMLGDNSDIYIGDLKSSIENCNKQIGFLEKTGSMYPVVNGYNG